MTESRAKDTSLLRRLMGFARPYRWGLFVGFILLILQVIATNAFPLVVKEAIDRFLAPGSERLPVPERLAGLQDISLLLAGLAFGMFLFRVSHSYLVTWVGQHVLRDLRIEVFRKVLHLPMRRVDQLRVGRLMTRATSDLDALQEFVRNGLIGMLANLLLLVGAMVFIWKMEWRLALALYAVFPSLGLLLWYVNHHSRKAQRDARTAISALNSQTQETLSGLFTLRVFNRRDPMRKRLSTHSDDVRSARARVADWGTWHFPILETTRALANAFLLLAFATLDSIEIGSLISFLMYIRYFFRPLEELAEQSQRLQTGLASAERVFDLLDEPEEMPDPEQAEPFEHVQGAIRFEHVNFAYTEGTPVLEDMTFSVTPGEFVAVVGATGAGKSTLLSLLCRFYEAESGKILVDGREIQGIRRAELRRHLGMVQQDPMLFSGSVAENIGLGRPGVTMEQIEEAAKRVNAHAFIEKLRNGYETELGEGGFRLSTGQKQLIALARVLLQDPEVLLMLDEATASVDSETEAWIQEGLETVRDGRTCFAIAHRLATIQHADRILVLRHGRLVEQGTHADLLTRDGYYRDLVEAMRIGIG